MPLFDESSTEKPGEDASQRIIDEDAIQKTVDYVKYYRQYRLLYHIIFLWIIVMILNAGRKDDEEESPEGFRKITDSEEREQIARMMEGGEMTDLHLDIGEAARLPSGTIVERTEGGFTIIHK